MPRYKVAHLREQGVDLIIVPLDDVFESKSRSDQDATIGELQLRARHAGLAGTVVPVWNRGGRMRFIAPQNWHPFFSGLSMNLVFGNLNRELYW